MSRYWMSADVPNSVESGISKEERMSRKKIEDKMRELGFKEQNDYQMVFVSQDKDEVIKVHKAVLNILETTFNISTQPECPKCGFFGRFKDRFCSQCGTELQFEKCIEIEDLKDLKKDQ